jgi:phospholipid/cholesterol/gamma-HCH transport system substrate-binding protein
MPSSRKIALGVFLAGGFLLFALGLFWIGDRRLMFAESLILHTEFTNLSGLRQGSKVRVSGMDAGEVLLITVPAGPGDKFRVRFRVLARFHPILRGDSISSIQTDGLVGNKFLQIEPGSAAALPVAQEDTIPSREPLEFGNLMQQAVETVSNLNATVTEVRENVDEVAGGLIAINNRASELIDEVGGHIKLISTTGNKVVQEVSAVIDGIQAGRGTIGKLVNDEDLYHRLRATVEQAESTARNLQEVSNDMQQISSDLKAGNIVKTIEETATNIREVTGQAKGLLASLRPEGPDGEGLSADLRQTLSNAEEATAHLAENMRALKRSWFFRGFFNDRGFFDLDAVSVEDYTSGKFAPDRTRQREWLHASEIFTRTPEGLEQLSESGKKNLDAAMAGFLRHARNNPLMIEGYASAGTPDQQFLLAQDRAHKVRSYLVRRFQWRPNYVGVMPMGAVKSAAADESFWDGVALVLFPSKDASAKKTR